MTVNDETNGGGDLTNDDRDQATNNWAVVTNFWRPIDIDVWQYYWRR